MREGEAKIFFRGNRNIICKNVNFTIKSINRNNIFAGSSIFFTKLQKNTRCCTMYNKKHYIISKKSINVRQYTKKYYFFSKINFPKKIHIYYKKIHVLLYYSRNSTYNLHHISIISRIHSCRTFCII